MKSLYKLHGKELLQIILCSDHTFIGTCKEMIQYIIDQKLVSDEEFLNSVLFLSINDNVGFWSNPSANDWKTQYGFVSAIDYQRSKIEVMYFADSEEPETEILEHYEVWAQSDDYS